MPSNSTNIYKLQRALNSKGCNILYTTSQFWSTHENRPVTIYHIKQGVVSPNSKRATSVELFSATSQIQIVLFLRDMWYQVNGMEVPTDNEMWNNIKQQYYSKIKENE